MINLLLPTRRYKIIAVSLVTSRVVARLGCAAARKRSTPQTATIYSANRYALFRKNDNTINQWK